MVQSRKRERRGVTTSRIIAQVSHRLRSLIHGSPLVAGAGPVDDDRGREETHIAGVITGSHPAKLRMIAEGSASTDRALRITKRDFVYTKEFLLGTSQSVNERVGKRLESPLDTLHRDHPALFDAREMADRVPRRFGFSITI